MPMVWVDNRYALAGHNDACDVWGAIGYPNAEAAEQATMLACAIRHNPYPANTEMKKPWWVV
jgi:hypothetical protein